MGPSAIEPDCSSDARAFQSPFFCYLNPHLGLVTHHNIPFPWVCWSRGGHDPQVGPVSLPLRLTSLELKVLELEEPR